MRSITKIQLFVLTILLSAIGVSAQDARLRFDNLTALEKNASEIVEVNVDGKLLQLAKRVLLKIKDEDAKKVGKAIEGLEGVYVRSFNFDNEIEYNMADVDAVRNQLNAPGWGKLAQVRSKKKNQKIDVYMMFAGEDISGLAVILSDKKQVALINVIGPIDIDTLVELSGKMNIPEISITKDGDPDQPDGN
ncbi:MAG: DUF4252 domain-containing protein [Acidobacteria bacterium]|nr:DUF4252 domain-containing protein [Acidobacteriota bacterium]